MKNFPVVNLPKITEASDIDQVLDPFYQYIKATFNCCKVGIIQSFNPTNQRAVVQLVDLLRKNTYEGEKTYKIAPLIDCPVFIPYGSGGLTFPIKEGLECLVLFSDKDIENWKVNGTISKPNTYRMHDIADGLCLVGIKSNSKLISNYDNDAVGLISEEGAQIKLDDKVKISNNDQDLKSLVANLISILQNLKVVDPVSGNLSIDATTSNDLSTLLTNFNQLLK